METLTGGNSGNVTHAFAVAGTFEVGVTVTDEDGAVSELATHAVALQTATGGAGTAELVGGQLRITGTDGDEVIG